MLPQNSSSHSRRVEWERVILVLFLERKNIKIWVTPSTRLGKSTLRLISLIKKLTHAWNFKASIFEWPVKIFQICRNLSKESCHIYNCSCKKYLELLACTFIFQLLDSLWEYFNIFGNALLVKTNLKENNKQTFLFFHGKIYQKRNIYI